MSSSHLVSIGADLVAIVILVFGIYFPRYHHRDMVVAFLGINVGILAIAADLSAVSASVSLGLGLFGVLSIIRLRSDELSQRQVAYYFASLALGLLGGTPVDTVAIPIGLMALLLIVLWVSDHPRLLARHQTRIINLDRAFADESQLVAHLSGVLGSRVYGVHIQRVDFVNDTTLLEVRYETPRGGVEVRS